MPDVLLLDGAMGTALLAVGLGEELPERWVFERPEAIRAVHAAHAAAGARLILSCTFNLGRVGTEVEELARAAVALARAAAPGALVAGALGPAGPAPVPGAPPSDRCEARSRYERPFRALAAAGVDLLWTETHRDLAEARAALAAARSTGLPVAVAIAPSAREGRLEPLPDGCGAGEALRALAAEGAVAVGVNCVLPGAPLADFAAELAPALRVPLVVKPSAGLPGAVIEPAEFGTWVAGAARAGAAWVGGCCGVSAPHLAALRAELDRSHRGDHLA